MSENQQQLNQKQEMKINTNSKTLNIATVMSQQRSDDCERFIQRNNRLQKSQYQDQISNDLKKNYNQQHQQGNSNNDDQSNADDNERSSTPDDNKSQDDEDQMEDSNEKSDNKDQEEGRSDEDMKKQQPSGKKCFNKLCNSKKIYKKLRSKVEHAKYRFFCRQCYESYFNNDFCEFCQQIYSSTANSDDDDQWVGCDSCTRWNHIQCQKKFRNKDINEVKDQDTQYLCLTCSYKPKEKNGHDMRPKGKKQTSHEDQKSSKQNIQISRDQRVQIFSKKIESLPSLQYFLQNYNFRLWINENLIKDDLQTLREVSRKSQQDMRKNKKVKIE